LDSKKEEKKGGDRPVTGLSNWGWPFVFNKTTYPRGGGYGKSGDLVIGKPDAAGDERACWELSALECQ